MATPSEVFAGKILDEVLGFNDVKFVDKAYDYEARSENHKCVIEVKLNILSPRQIKTLAKRYSKGDKAFLLIVDKDRNYCFFELTSTNLGSPPSPSIIEAGKVARALRKACSPSSSGDSPCYLLVSMNFLTGLLEVGKRLGKRGVLKEMEVDKVE